MRWTLDQPGNDERALGQRARRRDQRRRPERHSRPARAAASTCSRRLQPRASGAVEEGSVGAGTGTQAFGWKGGIGTSSRTLDGALRRLHRRRARADQLRRRADDGRRAGGQDAGPLCVRADGRRRRPQDDRGDGSCMIVVATDAPLDARDLKRLAARAVFGLARTGSSYSNGSGDFAIAFSTARGSARRGSARRAAAAAHAAADRRRLAAVPGGARGHRRSRLQLAAARRRR